MTDLILFDQTNERYFKPYVELALESIGKPDILIEVSDDIGKKIFELHKSLLVKFSPVFESMFDVRFKQEEVTQVKSNSLIFGKMIDILYHRFPVSVTLDELVELINIMDFYEIKSCYPQMKNEVMKRVTRENIIDICNRVRSVDLKEECLDRMILMIGMDQQVAIHDVDLLINCIKKYDSKGLNYKNGVHLLHNSLKVNEKSILNLPDLKIDHIFTSCPACNEVAEYTNLSSGISSCLTCCFTGFSRCCAFCSTKELISSIGGTHRFFDIPNVFQCQNCLGESYSIFCATCNAWIEFQGPLKSKTITHDKCKSNFNLLNCLGWVVLGGSKKQGYVLSYGGGVMYYSEFYCEKCDEWNAYDLTDTFDIKRKCSCHDKFHVMKCEKCHLYLAYDEKESSVTCNSCTQVNLIRKCPSCKKARLYRYNQLNEGGVEISKISCRSCGVDIKRFKCPFCSTEEYFSNGESKNVKCKSCNNHYCVAIHRFVISSGVYKCGRMAVYPGKLSGKHRCSCGMTFSLSFMNKMMNMYRETF